MLTDNTKEEINDITNYMTEENIDKLKDRLNEKVVFSQEVLEREIGIIEAYLYLGGETKPGQTEISSDDRAKIEAYLMLHEIYEDTMNDNKVIIVDRLEYESERPIEGEEVGVQGHFIFSALQTAEYHDTIKPVISEQEFRDMNFDPDQRSPKSPEHFSLFEISYYGGEDATSDKNKEDVKHLKNKESTYTADFLSNKALERIITEAASVLQVERVLDIASLGTDIGEHNTGDIELTNDIKVGDGVEAAGRLDMELGVSETRNIPGPGTPDVNAVQLVPTDKTFEIIERWQSLQKDYPHIDFPQEALRQKNWYEVSKSLAEIKADYGQDASNYIRNETLGIKDENIEDEELIKELEKRELDRIFGK